jgi:DNA polymerase III subunit gamma/tau
MTSSSSLQTSSYRVLARKYRPSTFEDMIGQEALVRVLTNGIQMGRLPHAFILTGIRGVGKTTTARIIARALNCIGSDGQAGPTASPCGMCEHCKAIAEDRHIDVVEMDAASRTSVDDVRSVIEGARYKAVSARFKVYIVDEVHMLSRNAFNAFLKTLEEPPPHVKFIFATTELHKVPETVLSRCMRLQLQRIDLEVLKSYLDEITRREGMTIDAAALTLIARAAEGSVRDGLSLLDQAMSLCEGVIREAAVADMLGLSDRTLLFRLFESCIRGVPQEALAVFQQMYIAGSDPLMVVQDLLDFTHWMMLQKMQIGKNDSVGLGEDQKSKALALLSSLSFPTLSRCWQTLSKGLQEAAFAPSVKQAVDIILLRLCYLAALPTPNEIIERAKDGEGAVLQPQPSQSPPVVGAGVSRAASAAQPSAALPGPSPVPSSSRERERQEQGQVAVPDTFEALLALLGEKREMLLKNCLENDTHLISYEPGQIRLRFLPAVPKETARRLRDLLTLWTGMPWDVKTGDEQGAPTIRESTQKARAEIRAQLLADPLVQTALATFPEAEIEHIDDQP